MIQLDTLSNVELDILCKKFNISLDSQNKEEIDKFDILKKQLKKREIGKKKLTWDILKSIIFSRKYTEEFSHVSKNSNITKKYKFPKNIVVNFKQNYKKTYNVYYPKEEPFYGGYSAVAFYKLDKLGKEEPSILKKKYKQISSLACKCIDFNNIAISGIYKSFFELLFLLKVNKSKHEGAKHIVKYIGYKDNIPKFNNKKKYEKLSYEQFKYYTKLEILVCHNMFPRSLYKKIKPYIDKKFRIPGHFYIFMERMDMDMITMIREQSKNIGNIKNTKKYLRQLCLSLDCIHSMGYVYNDLKPHNILFSEEVGIKLTDFNCLVDLDNDESGRGCSTFSYRPIELVSNEYYSKINCINDKYKIDSWVIGILSLQLLIKGLNRTKSIFNLLDTKKINNQYESNVTGRKIKPYDKKLFEKETIFYVLEYFEDLEFNYRNQKRLVLNNDYIDAYGIKNASKFKIRKIFHKLLKKKTSSTKKFIDFVKNCLQLHVSDRMDVKDLLNHPFLN